MRCVARAVDANYRSCLAFLRVLHAGLCTFNAHAHRRFNMSRNAGMVKRWATALGPRQNLSRHVAGRGTVWHALRYGQQNPGIGCGLASSQIHGLDPHLGSLSGCRSDRSKSWPKVRERANSTRDCVLYEARSDSFVQEHRRSTVNAVRKRAQLPARDAATTEAAAHPTRHSELSPANCGSE